MFEKLLARIGEALNKAAIPYIIIGGQAVLVYGEPRLTRDIDVTLGVNIDRLDEIMNIVRKVEAEIIPEDPEKFVKQTYVLPVKTENNIRVDFIFSFTPYERQACDRANKIKIKDIFVNFGSPEDIIILKVFAGRPRDLEDVKSILVKNQSVDLPYVKKWLADFDRDGDSNFQDILSDIIREVDQIEK